MAGRLPAACLLVLAATAARAASVSWVGGAVGDWNQPANWSGAAVPGPLDDAAIASELVVAYSTDPLVSVRSLTLGGAGAVLRTSTGVAASSALDVLGGAAIQVSTPLAIAAGSFTLHPGSSVTFYGPAGAMSPGAMLFISAGFFDLRAGSTVTLKGRGYAGGAGAASGSGAGGGGAGSVAMGGGGGGHGGAGGSGGGGANGGTSGDAMPAVDAGSGGGGTPSADGGGGGGFLQVDAATASLDGLLEADGETGVALGLQGGGGGAGGAIVVLAQVITGSGTVSARGGDGGAGTNFGGGGGGGGRVWLQERSGYSVLHAVLSVRVGGGGFGAGVASGGGGSLGAAFVDPRHWTGLGSDALASTPANWSEGLSPSGGERLVFGASATLKGCLWDLPSVSVGSMTLTTSLSTTVVLASSLTVTGAFEMAGGTIAAGAGLPLTVGGDLAQTGGRIDLGVSTLTLAGFGGACAASFYDAKAARLVVGGPAAATATVTGRIEVVSRAHLSAGALLVLSTGTVLFDGDGPFTGTGSVDGAPGAVAVAAGSSSQTWTAWPGRIGGLRVSNTNGLQLSASAGPGFAFAGGVSVDTGTLLRANTTLLQIGGDWTVYGAAFVGRSTAVFNALSGAANVSAGASFDNLFIDAGAGTLTLSTAAAAEGNVIVVSGALDLAASTLSVRGSWTEQPGTAVLGGTSVVVFDGASSQTVRQLATGSFGTFRSSSAAGVTLSSTVSTLADFEWYRGALAYPGALLTIRGDMSQFTFGALTVTGSTTVLAGAAAQNINYTTFDGLVVANRSSAGARLNINGFVSSFRILPGAVFDGGSSMLTVAGPVWDTAFSTYLAVNPAHTVIWSPVSSIQVASGSVVNAKLVLAAGKTAALLGDLIVEGDGNSFDPRQGSTVVNAPGGSTITLRGSSDLVPSSGADWSYAGDVANSWLLFEGTGAARGAGISTNTFGGLRVNLAGAGEVFRASTLNLSGPLVVSGGVLRPIAARAVSVAGGVFQTGGVVDFSASTSASLAMTGASTQTLSLLSGSTLWNLVSAGTGPVRAASDLVLLGDFTVAAGTFSAGTGSLTLAGSFLVSTGAYFDGQTSTVSLAGAAAGRSYESVAVYGGAVFNGLSISVASAAFLTSAAAAVLTDAVAGSTLAFAPGALLSAADLRLGAGGGAVMRVRSRTAGLPWSLRVTAVSSVTAAMVSDCDASSGKTVPADDGRSVDAGGNFNWDFAPNLVVLLPGETFTPAVDPGKTGAPSVSTAGAVIAVTVLAVSSRFDLVWNASGTVTLASDDPYAVLGAAQPLSAGMATFQFTPRSAEPSPRATVVSAATAFGLGYSTTSVIPAGLARLQVILPGQAALPGSVTGKAGSPFARVAGAPFSATVRAVDPYWNKISTVGDTVALGAEIASVVLPAPQALAAGQLTFSGLIVQVTGYWTLSVTDLTQPFVASDTSSVFGVALPSLSSPTAYFHVPTGAAVATLNGAISGTAADGSAVERVRVDIREVETGLHFDWLGGSFSGAVPDYSTTTLAAPLTPATSWSNPITDAALTDGRHYCATAFVEDPTGLTGMTASTFTVDRSALSYGARDGQGSAFVAAASTAGCQAVVATVTFTVGGSGLSAGGALAVRVPDGWSVPIGTTTQFPPQAGYWTMVSTSLASIFGSTSTEVNPAARGAQALGAGWIVVSLKSGAAEPLRPGEKLVLTYAGMPPLGPSGRGAQTFAVWTQADASGTLAPISTQPVLSLGAGTTSQLAFTHDSTLVLGPLQSSPTLQLRVTDLCGNDKLGASSGTVNLSLIVPSGGGYISDATARFTSLAGSPISSVFLSTGFAASPGFFLKVSTVGPSLAYIRAAANFTGTAGAVNAEAMRPVRLVGSTVAFTAVSVDSGTLRAGTTSVSLSSTDPSAYEARIVFSLPDPALAWDLVLSTDAVDFGGPVMRAAGFGDPARPVVASWDGVDHISSPPRAAPAGRYRARLRAGGGAAENRALEVVVPAGASYVGRLGSRGAGAWVRATGPGASEGAFAVATATGYFQLFGLRAGAAYRLSVATAASVGGRFVNLSTEVAAAAAAAPFTDLGSLALPATAQLRVAVIIPVASPRDALGGFVARAADGSAVFSGPLRFSTGAATSDDAGPLFGRAASTWSVVVAAPGVYDLDLEVADLRLSTRVPGVSLGAGGLDLVVPLDKRANVFGWAVLPSTTAFGVFVSVQARKAGEIAPSAFGGVFISSMAPAVGPSSAAYALYGLEPGTWTILAVAPGFTAASTTVVLADAADLSVADLALGMGGVVTGTVTVTGDSRGVSSCFAGPSGAPGSCPAGVFELEVEALAVGRLERAAARVRLPTAAVASTAAFTLSGLGPGIWTLRSSLPGFTLQPAGGLTLTVAAAAVSTAALGLAAQDARLRVDVRLPALPGGACRASSAYRALGLELSASDGLSRVFGDATAMTSSGAFVAAYCSSATLFTAALPPGPARAAALFAGTGGWAAGRVLLVEGATAALTLDLSGSTVSVSGIVAVSGELSLSTRTASGAAFSVAASSPAGILSAAPGVSFCLLGSGDPQPRSALRAELIAFDPREGARALRRSSAGAGSCAALAPSSAAATSLGLVAAVSPDGSFNFPSGVGAGLYILRVSGDLDDDPSNGPEAVESAELVSVGTAPVVLSPRLTRGSRVSGLLGAPPNLPSGRRIRVFLADEGGRTVRSVEIAPAPGGSAPFAFDGAADGRYSLSAEDLGAPRAFAAVPRPVEIAGADLSGLALSLAPSGTIRARLSAARLKSDGAEEHELIGRDNAALLPRGLTVRATAVPARGGGFFVLRPAPDGSILDAAGRAVLDGLPAGVYDVEFIVPVDTTALAAGGLALSPARVSGVALSAGQAVDLGVVPLFAGAFVSGRVTDAATGAPVPGARVTARASRGAGARAARTSGERSTATDAEGLYLLRGLDPTTRWYDLTAAPRGELSSGDPLPPYEARRALGVDVSSGAVRDFALSAAASTVSGRVVAADGAALRSALGLGAALSLQKAGLPPAEDPLADLVFRTQPDGTFAIPAVATGAYRLTASALGLAGAARAVIVSTAATDLGLVTLGEGASLGGTLRLPDGSAPSEDEVGALVAAAPDSSEFYYAALTRDAAARAVTGYRFGGLTPGRTYRLIVSGPAGWALTPPEGAAVVLTSTSDARVLDLVLRPAAGPISFRARREGARWRVEAEFPRPLRARFTADDDPALALSTTAALAPLSAAALSLDRRSVSAYYDPVPGETSLVLRARAALAAEDWSSTDPSARELTVEATATISLSADGLHRRAVANSMGGTLSLEGDAARVVLPRGALAVDASSAVMVDFARSAAPLRAGVLPAGVAPAGAFFDVALPAGVPTRLARPAELTLSYSSAVADAGRLAVYWYNPAARIYVRQPDVTGAPPVVDAAARTVAIRVDHFSTYVLLDASAGAIGGSSFSGADLEAYNFPNPFDLSVKTVTTVHGGGIASVRGTLIRVSVPPAVSGGGTLRVFDVAGRLVRTMDLGLLSGGQTYYQAWDGRGDDGRDAASGLYIGLVEVGGRRRTFKMAVLK